MLHSVAPNEFYNWSRARRRGPCAHLTRQLNVWAVTYDRFAVRSRDRRAQHRQAVVSTPQALYVIARGQTTRQRGDFRRCRMEFFTFKKWRFPRGFC